LGTLSTLGGTWPVRESLNPDSPDDAIAIFSTAGRLQGRSQIDGVVTDKPGIQILIRGSLPTTAYAKANAIMVVLDQTITVTSVTVDSSTYNVGPFTRTSDILDLGREDGTNRHLYSLNYVVDLEKTS
jgi:hypothetical protein